MEKKDTIYSLGMKKTKQGIGWLVLCFMLCAGQAVSAQTILDPPACGGYFYDSGGPDSNYPRNVTEKTTIVPENPGDKVSVTFISFDVEGWNDGLLIYNGPDESSPLLSSGWNSYGDAPVGSWNNTSDSPVSQTFTSTHESGALTFVLKSNNNSAQGAGWVATVECIGDTPVCEAPTAITVSDITIDSANIGWTSDGTQFDIEIVPAGEIPTRTPDDAGVSNPYAATGLDPATAYDVYVRQDCGEETSLWTGPYSFTTLTPLPACGVDFYDNGGSSENYSNNLNETTTIVPDNPEDKVSVTFTYFDTEENEDGFMIYNGPDTSAPLIASSYVNTESNANLLPTGAWSGSSLQGETITSTHESGALTFVFTSDQSVNRGGWEATIACGAAVECEAPTFVEDSKEVEVEEGEVATVADIPVEEEDIVWYLSEEDAVAGENALESTAAIADGDIYFGVTRNAAGCIETALEVTVSIVSLSSSEFDLADLNVYPNPTDGDLNVSYAAKIDRVEVFNIVGQKIIDQTNDSTDLLIRFGSFERGTYIMILHSEGVKQHVKVVKK